METWLCLRVKINKTGHCEMKIKNEVTLLDKTRSKVTL